MRTVRLSVGMVILAFAAASVLWPLHKSRTFQLFGEIIPRVETAEMVVALTFDDGPTSSMTEAVLAALDENDVKATFFVVGRDLEAHMEEAKKLVQAGHELGNHSYSHRRMVLRTPSVYRDEVERTDVLIRRAGHRGEIFFRPPYGKKLFGLPFYLSRTGRRTVMWDVEPESFPEVAASADRIAAHVLENVRPGSVILLHVMYPSRSESVAAIGPIVRGLKARGYRFVTLSELLELSR